MRNQNRNIKDELTELGATHLAEWQGKTVDTSPPSAFFPQLAEDVLAEVNDKNTASPLKVVRHRVARPWWRVAVAAVVILALGSWWLSSAIKWPGQDRLTELDWQHIADDELQDYVWTNIDDFELELLEQFAEPATTQPPLETEFNISIEALEDFIQTEEEWLESDELDLF